MGLLGGALVPAEANASENIAIFESGQVRPMALSPSGNTLFVVNTPDNRLEVFRVGKRRLRHTQSIPVGMEPVAVAARSNHEVWVVNHLSDSVSIVDVHGHKSRVVQTLLVGDEPRDIVFAGPGGDRAFIACAHRGQNVPFDPQFTTPGVGRSDVWVYDANNVDPDELNGGPLNIVNLFSDTPRALAVSPDGSTVYAAAFNSGNQTTIVTEFLEPPLPPPQTDFTGAAQPRAGLIVRWDGTAWRDELNRPWDQFINFSLPDKDVFAINADTNPPEAVSGMMGHYPGVGTVLYNMAVNPVSGKIYVSNTEARNEVRFEGPGVFSGSTVRGHHNENRITILEPSGVTPRHLNKHLDFSTCCAPIPNANTARSLALPTGMEVTKDGKTLFVAALGSSKVAMFDTQALEQDSFVPNENDHISVTGGGPTGLVLDEKRKQLYVMTRFDNSISIIDTKTKQEVKHVSMFNPEPASVTTGRQLLYDASVSSLGDSACATCHVFGDKDDLSWDLGNPDETYEENLNPDNVSVGPFPVDPSFAPLKGPFATQSLRGMANHGPQHWRGDRTGSKTEPNIQPDSGAYNEREAFRQFQAGFINLLGRPNEIPAEDMEAFTDFILQVMYPPNPIRNLDNSLTPAQQAGRDFFFDRVSDSGVISCEGCHVTNPEANAEFGVPFPGFFGTDGRQAREAFEQMMKVPHLRNLYTKIGMFGFFNLDPLIEAIPGQLGFQGDQIRGFGVSRSGDIDTVFRFLHATNFSTGFLFGPNPEGFAAGPAGQPERRDVEQFLLAFDSNLKPIVGQQITLTKHNATAVGQRVSLLAQQATEGNCDLVVKGSNRHGTRGYLYLGGGSFLSDEQHDGTVSGWKLAKRYRKHKDSMTFTCVPPGTGYRIAVDRDDDGVLDGDDDHLN